MGRNNRDSNLKCVQPPSPPPYPGKYAGSPFVLGRAKSANIFQESEFAEPAEPVATAKARASLARIAAHTYTHTQRAQRAKDEVGYVPVLSTPPTPGALWCAAVQIYAPRLAAPDIRELTSSRTLVMKEINLLPSSPAGRPGTLCV